MDVVINLKAVGGRYNSFQNSPDLLPFADRALVKSSEAIIEPEIMAYPFQTETSISDWHYRVGQKYMDATTIVKLLMQNVSRNGTMLLNLTQHGRGDLDEEVVNTVKNVGAWLKVNGEAVYGSRPFEVCGDSVLFYTRNNGKVYAAIQHFTNAPITLKDLSINSNTVGKVTKVEILGSGIALPFVQNEQGLTITPPPSIASLKGVNDPKLADFRVLRITNDKNWTNDDDPGVSMGRGWYRQSNLNKGDFNNDLTISDSPGAMWAYPFSGKTIAVVAPKEAGAGKIEIMMDGKSRGVIDLSANGAAQKQQIVFKDNNLPLGKHSIKLINRGGGQVAIDALITGK